MKYRVGDKVVITGELYYSSNDTKPKSYVKDKHTTITRIAVGSRHPYNTTGDLGWMNESDISLYEEKDKYEVEMEVIDKDDLIPYINAHPDKIIVIDSKQLYEVIGKQL